MKKNLLIFIFVFSFLLFSLPAFADWDCGDTVTFTYRGSSVTYGTVVSSNNTCWLDRNLGASGVASSVTDSSAYGDLFQWGREDDGHQSRSSNVIEGDMTLTTQPNHANFITEQDLPYDWADPTWITRWTVTDYDPCPLGWHIPTYTEWNTERVSWSSNDSEGAFASPLKLTLGGDRTSWDASLDGVDGSGFYWSSTPDTNFAYDLSFSSGIAGMVGGNDRAFGFSVRCLGFFEEEPPAPPPPTGYFPTNFATSSLAYAGELITDLKMPIFLIVGLGLGAWVIRFTVLLF